MATKILPPIPISGAQQSRPVIFPRCASRLPFNRLKHAPRHPARWVSHVVQGRKELGGREGKRKAQRMRKGEGSEGEREGGR